MIVYNILMEWNIKVPVIGICYDTKDTLPSHILEEVEKFLSDMYPSHLLQHRMYQGRAPYANGSDNAADRTYTRKDTCKNYTPPRNTRMDKKIL